MTTAPTQTHYDVLGVSASATARDITLAYRGLIRLHHPDRRGPSGTAMTVLLNQSFGVIGHPTKRADYDRAQNLSPVAPRTAPAAAAAPAPRRRPVAVLPEGSGIRLALIGSGVLFAAAGLWLTVLTGGMFAPLTVMASGFGGVLLSIRRPPTVAYIVSVAAALIGVFGPAEWTTADGGFGLLTAAAGWTVLGLAAASLRALRRRNTEAADWDYLVQATAMTGMRPAWIHLIEGRHTLIEELGSGVQRTVPVWKGAKVGTWVSLSSSGAPLATASETAFKAWSWVEARR